MAYNSAHTGPEIDAAVQLLGEIQEAKNSTDSDRQAVAGMASTVATQAAQVSSQAGSVSSNTAVVLASASAVESDRAEVEQNTALALSAKEAAEDAQSQVLAAKEVVEIIQSAVSNAQVAVDLSEQNAGDSASSARSDREIVEALAIQTADDRTSAAESAAAAAAVVTGGTATLNPEPGKIPLAKGDGKIDEGWLPAEIARESSLGAISEQAEIAISTADAAQARTARFLESAATPPEQRDDGLPLQPGDRYFNNVSQAEFIYKADGWVENDSLQAIADLEAQITVDPTAGLIPRAGDDGKILDGWLGAKIARHADVVALGQELDAYKTESDQSLMGVSTDQRTMYRRRIKLQLPIRGQYHDAIYALGFTFLYPTAIAVDKSADQVIISYGTTGTSNIWAYWYFYSLSTGALINCLRVEHNVNESIVIRYESGSTYSENMFPGATRVAYTSLSYDLAAAGQSNLGRIDLTGAEDRTPLSALPVTFPVAGRTVFSWMDWTGEEWIVQHYGRSQGRFRRFLFDRFSPDFSTRVGTITTPFNFTGDTSGDNYLTSPKSQGFAALNGDLFCSIGAPFRYSGSASNNNPRAPGKQIGLACVDSTGGNLRAALCQADKFIECLQPHIDFVPLQSETEGLSSNNGTIYNLWLGLSPNDEGATAHGLVLFEEMSADPDAIDFSPYGTHQRGINNDVAFQSRVHHDDSPMGLCHPITGVPFTSWTQICNAMIGVGWSTYRFVGTGQAMTDILGNTVNTSSCVFEFTSVGGTIFYVEIFRNTGYEKWYVSPSAGTQFRTGFTYGIALSSLPVDQSAVVVNDNTLGKISTYKNQNSAATQFEFWTQTADGLGKQLAGYIRCNNLTTAFNTTSDRDLKTKLRDFPRELAREVLKLIRIYGFVFNGSDKEEFGPFAQELYEIYPHAVTPGFWSAVNPETGEEHTCQECEVATYTPWAVDKSKLVDVVIVGMQDIDERLSALESK